jgi:N utilization substance protein B
MASRRKSREVALQMLFQWEQGKHTPRHVIDSFLRPLQAEPEVEKFACDLFEGTVGEVETLDQRLGKHAENWRLERMAAVDRNLLRLAVYELIHYPETPPAVVINEALEIARRFSDKASVDFVNGVLDAIRKGLADTPAQT